MMVQLHKIMEGNQQKWAAFSHMASAMSCEERGGNKINLVKK